VHSTYWSYGEKNKERKIYSSKKNSIEDVMGNK
jgi:hypothetical protein